MRIRTIFMISVLLSAVILAAIAVSIIITNRMVEKASAQEEIAGGIAQGASELSYLSNDYLIYWESQQLHRWQTRFASFSSDVDRLQPDKPEQQALVRSIQANTQRLRDVFDSVVSGVVSMPQNQGGTIDPAFLQVSWSRMAVQSQGLVSDASRLSQLLHTQVDQLKQTNMFIIYAMMGVLGSYFLINYLMVQTRTLKSIAMLQAGAAVIGSGDLDFKIAEKKNDEIGDLSRSFNQMTTNLKKVTTTKAELEKEIEERKQAEEALRQSETRFRTLFETMSEGFSLDEIIYDDTGKPYDLRYLMVNPAFERQTGLKAQDIVGRTTLELFPQADAIWFERYGKVALTGEPAHFEAWFGPLERYFEVSAYRTEPGRFAVVSFDITDRKQAERLKDEFIGMVSHELKTPITVIMGAIYTAMSEGITKKEARQLLEDAASSADSLADIVDNLLDLSRAQANRLIMRKEPIDISETARKVALALTKRSEIHHLVVDIPAGLPAVQADQVRVERILHNLVENAIKYSPDGGTITVFAQQRDNHLVVGVKDEGIGISAEDQARLFQPFERLGTTSRVAGVGLGLNVCRQLVEAHSGSIWVESEPGKGATFFFTLPV